MRRLAVAVALLAVLACSSKKDPSACPDTDGTYVLAVSPTGQSENDDGLCTQQASAAMQVDVQVNGSDATVGAQACAVTSTAGCQIAIDCAGVDASAVTQASVRYVTFGLPTPSDPNVNALVALGPAYCAFQGTAAVASSSSSSSSSSGH